MAKFSIQLNFVYSSRKDVQPKNLDSIDRYLNNNHTTKPQLALNVAPLVNPSTKPPLHSSHKTNGPLLSNQTTLKSNEAIATKSDMKLPVNSNQTSKKSSPNKDSNSTKERTKSPKRDVNQFRPSLANKYNHESDEKLHLNQ